MKVVPVRLDAALIKEIDRAASRLGLTRSAFARYAFRDTLERLRLQSPEQRHREGYRRKPVQPAEFSSCEYDQSWPD
jgi:metal-responsive CopG/Arc/MetJ family transcriptional regulator